MRFVDVRVLAATNRNLEREVEAGRFRADLFHRLNVYPLRVAPLRERAEDVALLAGHFCERARRRIGTGPVRLAPETLSALKSYKWPGNVRELENTISRAVLKASAGADVKTTVIIEPRHLDIDPDRPAAAEMEPVGGAGGEAEQTSLKDAVDDFRKEYILGAVRENNGNWAAAARKLGVHRSNLHKLAARLGIK